MSFAEAAYHYPKVFPCGVVMKKDSTWPITLLLPCPPSLGEGRLPLRVLPLVGPLPLKVALLPSWLQPLGPGTFAVLHMHLLDMGAFTRCTWDTTPTLRLVAALPGPIQQNLLFCALHLKVAKTLATLQPRAPSIRTWLVLPSPPLFPLRMAFSVRALCLEVRAASAPFSMTPSTLLPYALHRASHRLESLSPPLSLTSPTRVLLGRRNIVVFFRLVTLPMVRLWVRLLLVSQAHLCTGTLNTL